MEIRCKKSMLVLATLQSMWVWNINKVIVQLLQSILKHFLILEGNL